MSNKPNQVNPLPEDVLHQDVPTICLASSSKDAVGSQDINLPIEEDETDSIIELAEDKPTTFLAMNLDPLMVRKSCQHIDNMAQEIERNYREQEKEESKENLDNIAHLRTANKSMSGNMAGSSSVYLLPERRLNIGRSVSGSMSITVNKMSVKLYGSEKAVIQEQQRMEKAGQWIIHPYSNFRFIWDSLSLLMLLANIILIPVAITFWHNDESGWLPFKVSSVHRNVKKLKTRIFYGNRTFNTSPKLLY